ncbi:MAG: NAD(P)-binding protein [Pseudomonadales bacterium]|nr:NAD(P)-binding protein [Pseudomonadales bacterium]
MQDHTIVIGGSISGLVTALALARNGRNVTVLEKESMPLPPAPEAAFDGWQRRGAPQVLQSHAFLGRMHNLIRDREPALLSALLAAGAEQLTFREQARQYFDAPIFEPADDDIVLLACRRVTFEWVLRKHVLETGLVEIRNGTQVTGLVAEPTGASGIPRITGVEISADSGRTTILAADRVIDASGRRSRLSDWLERLGIARMRQEVQPCGIFYASRFYRLRDGVERPNNDGIIGGDLGYVKFGVFPGDGRTFSVTLAAAPDDDPFRAILRIEGFEKVSRALPSVWEWVRPDIAMPISEVNGMADLWNTRRHFVEHGRPLALGLIPLGDALVHANPLTGRGCSLAWIAAYALAELLEQHAAEPERLVLEFEETIEREMAPWLAMQMRQDEDAIDINLALRNGEDPYRPERKDGSIDPKAYARDVLRQGLAPAIREDLGLMRTFSRIVHMLDAPRDITREGDVMMKIMSYYNSRSEREPVVRGPSREEMLALLNSA